MSELVDYLRQHAVLRNRERDPVGTDVVYFRVIAAPGSDRTTLRALVLEHKGVHCDVDLFDGKDHGYIEIGAWLGSQQMALGLIGLGAELELWNLLTPKTMLGKDVAADIEQLLAGQGLVSMQAPLLAMNSAS